MSVVFTYRAQLEARQPPTVGSDSIPMVMVTVMVTEHSWG